MPSQVIPLVGSIINRNTDPITSFASRDQYFDNCYPEVTKNPVTGTGTAYLYKRQGTTHNAGAGGVYKSVAGGCVWSGGGPTAVFPQIDSTAHALTVRDPGGTVLTQADIGSDSVLMSETTISGVANLTFVATKFSTLTRQAWFFPTGGASTEIIDVDFPPNQTPALPIVGDMVHLNGKAYVLTSSGQAWNSDLNTLSGWTASAFQSAQNVPDTGCGLARYKDLIVAFGKTSIEFFQDSGLTPSPLTPIANAVKHVGAISPNLDARSILTVADTVYWIGHEADSGSLGVYRLNGFVPEKVSNGAVDKLLAEYTGSNSLIGLAGSFSMHGMTHVLLDVSQAGLTQAPCYCVNTGVWWYMKPSSTQKNWNGCVGVNGVAYFTTNFLVSGVFVATPNSPVFQDNAVAMTQTVQIGPLDFGTSKRKTITRLALLADTQASTSNVGVSYSDDDGVTFSTERNIDLASARKVLTGLGSHENARIYRFTHAANTPNRMRSVEIDYTVST